MHQMKINLLPIKLQEWIVEVKNQNEIGWIAIQYFHGYQNNLPTAGQRQSDTPLAILDANCTKEHENVRLDSDVALPRSE